MKSNSWFADATCEPLTQWVGRACKLLWYWRSLPVTATLPGKPCKFTCCIFKICLLRPVSLNDQAWKKYFYFPASWAIFPSSIADFPHVFLYFFPRNHKISQEGASLFSVFFFSVVLNSVEWFHFNCHFGPIYVT